MEGLAATSRMHPNAAKQVVCRVQRLDLLMTLRASVQVYDYYAGGADTESTVRDNRAVYARYRLLPRYMVDVSHCDMTYTLLGTSGCYF